MRNYNRSTCIFKYLVLLIGNLQDQDIYSLLVKWNRLSWYETEYTALE